MVDREWKRSGDKGGGAELMAGVREDGKSFGRDRMIQGYQTSLRNPTTPSRALLSFNFHKSAIARLD